MRRLPGFLPYIALLALYVALMAVTTAEAQGDSYSYARDAARALSGEAGAAAGIWEFGHLLWRPLGVVLWTLAAPAVASRFDGDRALQVYFLLYIASLACGACVPLLAFRIARVAGGARVRSACLAAACIVAHPVLNYSQTGTPYIPGLAFELAGLWLMLEAVRGSLRPAPALWGAGAAVAGAVLMWFPFIVGVPGLFAAGLLWDRKSVFRRDPELVRRIRLLAAAAVAAVLIIGAVNGAGMLAAGVRTPRQAAAWAASSSHGIDQDRTAMRLVTAIPRAFLNLGQDGLVLKRYVVRDPYAQTGLADVLRLGLWKLFVVFLALGALLIALWRRGEQGALAAVVLTGAPLLAFALLWNPGSPERFLPAFPVLLLAAAAATHGFRVRCPEQALLAFFPIAMAAVNVSAIGNSLAGRHAHDVERIEALNAAVQPGSVAAVLSFRDGLFGFNDRYPFDPRRRTRFQLYALMEPGVVTMAHWREPFAARALETWRSGAEVWFSRRLLSPRPRPEWMWVEGEDRRLRWRDVHELAGTLEFDRFTGGEDGFARVAASARNRRRLEDLAAGLVEGK